MTVQLEGWNQVKAKKESIMKSILKLLHPN